jgi:hypothetical protein
MQQKRKIISILSAVCLLITASCSLTNLNAVWKDPQYQGGKLKNVLVIGGSTNQIIRRIFEDEFTAEFKTHGINAIQSYGIFPSEKTLDKDMIESKSRELGIDAILSATVVDRKTEKDYTPAPNYYYYRNSYFYDWPNRYSRLYPGGFPARYPDERLLYSEYEVVSIETSIYDTQTGKLIWSALSDTVIGGSSELEISSLIRVVMKNLSENQLIN